MRCLVIRRIVMSHYWSLGRLITVVVRRQLSEALKKKSKAAQKLAQGYGAAWQGMTESEKEKATALALYGCQHHARNIFFGRGHNAVEKHMKSLLRDDLGKLRQLGIQCVNGKQDMTLRYGFVK